MTKATISPSGPIDERIYLYGSALLISIGAGALVAHIELVWVAGASLAILALALAASREATLWFVVVTGLVLTGLSQLYVPGAKYIKYLPVLAAGALLLHVASDWLSLRHRSIPATVPAFLGFVLIGLISTGLNWSSIGMAVIGLKSYYPVWALFLGLAICLWRPAVIDSLPRAALFIALLQLPFAVSQYLFLVPMRANANMVGLVPVDIVAGTFGGSLYGGGANAVLSLFLITISACLVGMWRQSALSGTATTVGVALLLAPVMLNSSKVALLYVPIVFATIFYSQIIRQPLKALVALFMVGVLVVAMATSFTMLNSRAGSWQELLEQTYEGQMAPQQERQNQYSGLSRWTVLTFWADQHDDMNPLEVLIGHGPGATRVRPEGINLDHTLAETKYGGIQIGYTAVAALLWEVGVIGLLIVLWMFWEAFRQAGRLAAHHAQDDRMKSGIAHGLQASLVMLVLSLAHKDFFVFHIPYQTFLVLVFGYLAVQTNEMNRSLSEDVREPSPDQRLARHAR